MIHGHRGSASGAGHPLLRQDQLTVGGYPQAIICPVVNDDRLTPTAEKLGKLDAERRLSTKRGRRDRRSPIGALRSHHRILSSWHYTASFIYLTLLVKKNAPPRCRSGHIHVSLGRRARIERGKISRMIDATLRIVMRAAVRENKR